MQTDRWESRLGKQSHGCYSYISETGNNIKLVNEFDRETIEDVFIID